LSQTQLQQAINEAFRPRPAADIAALEAEIAESAAERQRLSDRIEAVALDATRRNEDRWAAFWRWARWETGSLDFLMKHIALVVPPGEGIPSSWTWPCSRALASAGWNAIPPVIVHRQRERSNSDLAQSAAVLRVLLRRDAAATYVRQELGSTKDELHRENLRRVLELLQQE
jgi:hypothetical protein